MSKIVPKLDLNKTPQAVQNNSLVYARNIKLLHDAKIVPDGAFDSIIIPDTNLYTVKKVYGYVPGLHNKIYFFINVEFRPIGGQSYDSDVIVEYNELENTFDLLDAVWKHNGSIIRGCVTINNANNIILTVCESNTVINTPIKHIPVNHGIPSRYDANRESLYTQHPTIPFIQLKYKCKNNNSVRSGIYQFFVRYKSILNTYTNWFLASNDIYSANITTIPTIQGGVSYSNEQENGFGFDFDIVTLNKNVIDLYNKVEIACLISTDGASVARKWKEFDINEIIDSVISFGYESGELEDISVDDLLANTFGIYDVENIDVLDNTLYIANYNEDAHENILTRGNVSLEKEDNNYDSAVIPEITDYIVTNTCYFEPATIYKYIGVYDKFTHAFVDYYSYLLDLSTNSDGYDTYGYDEEQKSPTFTKIKSNPFIPIYDENDNTKIIGVEDMYDTPIQEISVLNPIRKPAIQAVLKYEPSFNYHVEGKTSYILGFKFLNTKDGIVHYINARWNWQGNIELFNNNTEEDEFHRIIYSIMTSPDYGFWSDMDYPASTKQYALSSTQSVENFVKQQINKIQGIVKTEQGVVYESNGDVYLLLDAITVALNCWEKTLLIRPDIEEATRAFGLDFTNPTYIGNVPENPTAKDKFYRVATSIAWHRITFSYNKSIIDNDTNNFRTFLPKINYDFYIHFVKPNGIATKGYLLGNCAYVDNLDGIYKIKPTITAQCRDTEEYEYCFITIRDTSNVRFLDLVQDNITKNHYYSIETNALLDNNLTFIDTNNNVGVYCDSYSLEYFGAIATIKYDNNNTKHRYVLANGSTVDNNKDTNLIRVSPYIKLSDLSSNNEWYLPSFITQNIIPNYNLSKQYYVVDVEINHINGTKIEDVSELYNTFSQKIVKYSKWNTTLLSTVGGLNKTRFKTWQETNGTKTKSVKTIINTINSQEISTFLQLSNTFRDFIKPIYTSHIEDEIEYTRFDTMVRRSTTYSSEDKNFMYEFLPNEYYAIPNDKGDIVYLFTSGDTLLIHLTETLCKLNLENTIKTATENNLSIEEADMFKQAVSFVKDSRLGFAGLNDKKDTIVTEDFYMFFDKVANRLYLYDNQQLQDISLPFLKLLKLLSPIGVRIAYDRHCNRFYINFITTNNSLCVSYSLYSNGFVSLHDINYNNVITTRVNSYLLNDINDNKTIFKITNKKTKGTQYPNALLKPISYFKLSDNQIDQDVDTDRSSVIDIICNTEYEKIKVLNYIQWICKVTDKYDELDNDIADIAWSDLEKILVSEEQSELYCGNKIRVYSDQTYTPLLTLTTNRQDAYGVEEQQMGGYQDPSTTANEVYPRNNNGVWTLNDFRDVRQFKTTQVGNTDNSLVHGKYFVIRLIFKNNYFNLENVIFNIDNYEKV